MPHETGLQPGDAAPAFMLPDDTGHSRRLSDFEGRLVVLYFFPRADTPGCTTEAQDFSGLNAAFDTLNATVIGISADPPRKLARFRTKRDLSGILLSDEVGDTLRAYGAWGEKSMYGKVFQGVLRTTFLIDRMGRIAAVWRNVRVPNHAQAVYDAARNHT